MSRNRKLFELSDAEINRILFCDDTDRKDALVLDDKDIDFIENNVAEMEANSNTEDISVIIDPPIDAIIMIMLENPQAFIFHNHRRCSLGLHGKQ